MSISFPLTEVRPHNGAPALFINDEAVFPLLLMTAPDALAKLETIAPLPVHLLTDTFSLGWTGIGKYDFSDFDARMRAFLKVDPKALIMPRLHMDVPEEWSSAHPDEMTNYADPEAWNGDSSWGGARHASFASRLWLKDCGQALRALIRHVAQQEYSGHILGWHLGGGIYGEWHYPNAVYYPDTSPAFEKAFGDWLRERYPGEEIAPRIPTIEERKQADLGMFRDPAKSRWMLDWAEYFHLVGATALGDFARIVKEETGGRSIVLAFNGYLPDLGVNHEIDHRAFETALHDPNLDCFSSPHSYTRRAPGDDATLRGFLGSVRVAGKLWINEADERTHLAHPTQWKHVATREESVEVLWRSFAQAVTNNCGLWFMDQGGLWFQDLGIGWYEDEAILQAFADMRRAGAASMQRARTRPTQVALVSSFKTAFHLADRASGLDNITNTLINPALEQWTKCGVPFDLYLLPELFAPNTPDYQVYAFLDTFVLSDDELRQIKALRDAGKTLLFYYAPGFLSETEYSLERMKELLGMDVEMTDAISLPGGQEQRPGFVVRGASDALASAGNLHFCAAPPLPSAELRALLERSGVHIYLESDDPLMVGGGYVALHASTAGTKTIRNSAPVVWTDIRTGKTLARDVSQLTIEMTKGQTLILALD
jgi:hypothetical protein